MNTVKQQRFAIVGTGAVAGYYGYRLIRAGHDVHFVGRSHLDVLREQGLCLDILGEGVQRVAGLQVVDDVTELPACDWVLVTTKTTGNAEVAEQLLRLQGRQKVLLMQNGFGNEDFMRSLLPERFSLFAGLCFIYSQRTAPGQVLHLGGGSTNVGWHSGEEGEAQGLAAAQALSELFNAAGIESQQVQLPEARWQKLIWNIPYNGLSVVLNATTSMLMDNDSSLALVKSLMDEVVTAAAACGVELSPRLAPAILRNTAKMRDYHPSMYHDFVAGRPMELEVIYRAPLAAAASAGQDMPQTRMLLQQLEFMQAVKSQ